jgi:DNA polymerase III subunit delta'
MSNALDSLRKRWNENKFPHAWHIYSENPEHALEELKIFAAEIYACHIKVPLENNTDFKIISTDTEDKDTAKSISVEQIRSMQGFLNKSSSISPYKMVVIYKAETMNNNAFNSCLKILEEPPLGSFIFLITGLAARLPATILSRCHKLYIDAKFSENSDQIYQSLLEVISKPSFANVESIINKIVLKKDNQLWHQFSESCLQLIRSICRIKAGVEAGDNEALISIAHIRDMDYLTLSYEQINSILLKAFEQDLDRRHAAILVLDKLVGFSKDKIV